MALLFRLEVCDLFADTVLKPSPLLLHQSPIRIRIEYQVEQTSVVFLSVSNFL